VQITSNASAPGASDCRGLDSVLVGGVMIQGGPEVWLVEF